MDKMPKIVKVLLWIYLFPVMLIIYLVSKNNKPSSDKEKMKELILNKHCPHCGSEMTVSPKDSFNFISCPKYCVNFSEKTRVYYESNYFDERETDKRLKKLSTFVTSYKIYEKYEEDGCTFGVVESSKAKVIESAFEELRIRTLEETPITEENFKAEIEAGKKLIKNQCPFCEKMIIKNTKFIKGYGENVTKLVQTGYNELSLKTTFEGSHDKNVTTYNCGCTDTNYQLVEYEKDGMYHKKYTTTSSSDYLQKACAFSEIHTKNKTWF